MRSEVEVDVIYDVCHNIARVEDHTVLMEYHACCISSKAAQ